MRNKSLFIPVASKSSLWDSWNSWKAFSLQKVIEMLEEVVVGQQEVRWIWWIRQNSVCAMLSFVAQLFLTLCDPMDCSPPGSVQARILEWVVMPSSRGSSRPRDQTQVSCIAGRLFTAEPPGKPELGPFCWPIPVAGAAAFGAPHQCAEYSPQR